MQDTEVVAKCNVWQFSLELLPRNP